MQAVRVAERTYRNASEFEVLRFVGDNFVVSLPRASVRVVETVVLENGRFVPCRKQAVLTKIGENSDIEFDPQKQAI